MSPDELLAELRRRGATVLVDGGDLVCRAPRGVITPEVRAALAAQKPALLDRLVGPPAEVWWDDAVPAGSAPVAVIPPRQCIGPRACARLGTCDRHAAGRPCEMAP